MGSATTLSHAQVTLTGSAQRITTSQGKNIIIRNFTGNDTVYFGGSTVSAGNGFPIYAGEALSVDVASLGTLYVLGTAADVIAYAITA